MGDQLKWRHRIQKEFTPKEFQADDYPVHSGGMFHWNYNPDIELDPEDPASKQQVETEFGLLLKALPKIKPGSNPFLEMWDTGALSEPGEFLLEGIVDYYKQHQRLPRDIHDYRKNIVTIDAAEGEPLTTDRVAEIEEEESKGTLMGDIILSMFPSREKSWGENIFDIATLAVPPAKALKLGKLADPLLDTGIMQMANKGKTYGGGFTKPGMTKIRGGSKDITFKTRSPKEWNVYTDIARFSDGGSSPGKLTPQQVEQLRKIMPKLRAAASSQTRHGRSTMNNVVRMFDDNFK